MSRNLSIVAALLILTGCNQGAKESQEAVTPPAAKGVGAGAIMDSPVPDPQKPRVDTEKVDQAQKQAGVKVATWTPEQSSSQDASGALALMTGEMKIQGSCVLVALDNGALLQPVFPAGRAKWDADKQTLLFNNKSYKNGSTITLGGGGVPDDSSFRMKAGSNIPECPDAKLFVVSG